MKIIFLFANLYIDDIILLKIKAEAPLLKEYLDQTL